MLWPELVFCKVEEVNGRGTFAMETQTEDATCRMQGSLCSSKSPPIISKLLCHTLGGETHSFAQRRLPKSASKSFPDPKLSKWTSMLNDHPGFLSLRHSSCNTWA